MSHQILNIYKIKLHTYVKLCSYDAYKHLYETKIFAIMKKYMRNIFNVKFGYLWFYKKNLKFYGHIKLCKNYFISYKIISIVYTHQD